MRLDGNTILRPERREIERGHDRDDRGATGLMPPSLDAVDLRPDVVGVMDHPVGEPEQALFNSLQMGRVGHRQVPMEKDVR
ncbi:hypothetical protein D3C71_1835790 [compost metagenome]